ncbi:MAG: hypothetical protein IPK81_14025 [Rhodospirillales bacterium]|nr:MAG: hypothetical protein IPK81_14025 [Rhodospirillales bacterium]
MAVRPPAVILYTQGVIETYDAQLSYDPEGVREVQTEFTSDDPLSLFHVRIESESERIRLDLDSGIRHGTEGADLIIGATARAASGDDRGDSGDDVIVGEGGLDTMYGGGDTAGGGATYAYVDPTGTSQTFYGGRSGGDTFVLKAEAGAGSAPLYGGDGDDAVMFEGTVGVTYVLDTATQRTTLYDPGAKPTGMSDADYARLRASYPRVVENHWGIEAVSGCEGNDTFSTTARTDGAVTMAGNGGEDRLIGGIGDDRMDGGEGSDWIYGGIGNDMIDGGSGRDMLFGGDGDDFLTAETADPTIEVFTPGTSVLNGLKVSSEAAPIIIDGGRGRDTLRLVGVENVEVELDEIGIETLISGNGDDTLTQTGETNVFIGGGWGDDTITASDGHDSLEGGEDKDRISGGAGDDAIAMDAADLGLVEDTDTVARQFLNGDTLTDGYYGSLRSIYTTEGGEAYYLDADGVAVHGVLTTIAEGGGFQSIDPDVSVTLVSETEYQVRIRGVSAVRGGVGFDRLAVQGERGVSFDVGAGEFEMATGGAGNDHLFTHKRDSVLVYGEGGDDTLQGGRGNDLLNGGVGDDTLKGGIGNDTLNGADGLDIVSLADKTATLVVALAPQISGTTVYNVVGLDDTVTGTVWTVDDFRTTVDLGSGEAEVLIDVEGLVGGTGNDTFYGTSGGDILEGGAGADVLYGGFWRPATLQDSDGDDVEGKVFGGGDDVFVGDSSSSDTFYGGDDTAFGGLTFYGGEDTADYHKLTAGVTANLTSGTASHGLFTSDKLYGIEHLIGGTGNDALTGSARDNSLSGGAGNDVVSGGDGDDELEGGAGNDSLEGGSGNDTAIYAGALGAIVATLGSGSVTETIEAEERRANDTVDGKGTWTAGAGATVWTDAISSIEDLIAGDYNDTVTGSTAANGVEAGAGDDTVYGAAAADTLGGGSENDALYGGDNGSDSTVSVSGGYDTLFGGDILYGDSGVDTLYGDAGRDTVFGGSGNDVLYGGANGSDATFADGTLYETLYGGDSLYGDSGDDTLVGGADNDAHGDTLDGGAGSDTVSYAGTTIARVIHLDNLVVDDVELSYGTVADGSGVDTIVSVENAIGTSAADTIYGTDGQNVLAGGEGNDLLYGGLGADGLKGGAGNDVYYFRAAEGTTYAGDGRDVVLDAVTIRREIDLREVGGTPTLSLPEAFEFTVDWTNDVPDTTGPQPGTDTLLLGMSEDDHDRLVFRIDGGDMLVGIRPDGDTATRIEDLADVVRLRDFVNERNRVERIAFTDSGGTYWGWSTPDDGATWILTRSAAEEGLDPVTLGATDDGYTFHHGDGSVVIRDEHRYTTAVERPIEVRVNYTHADPDHLATATRYEIDHFVVDSGDAGAPGAVTRYVETLAADGGDDTLTLTGIAFEDAIFRLDGADLVIAVKDGDRPFDVLTDRVTIRDWLAASNRIEGFLFADGAKDAQDVLDTIDLAGDDAIDAARGGADFLPETLDTGAGDDSVVLDVVEEDGGIAHTLTGGIGNDTLNAGAGNDVYVYRRGDGRDQVHYQAFEMDDTIVRQLVETRTASHSYSMSGTGARTDEYIADFFELSTSPEPLETDGGTNDILRLTGGIALSDLVFRRDGNDLVVGVRQADYVRWQELDDRIVVRDHFQAGGNNRIEWLELDGGHLVDLGALTDVVAGPGSENFLDQTLSGTDSTTLSNGSDWFEAGEGHDVLYGGTGTVTVATGDDYFVGGAGNDTMYGGDGDDRYYAGAGTDEDTVVDSAGSADMLVVGVLPEIVAMTVSGGNGVVEFVSGDHVTILGQDTSGTRVENLHESSAGRTATWNTVGTGGGDWIVGVATVSAGAGGDVVIGSAAADTVDGGGDSDYIMGGSGSDTLDGGSGEDTLSYAYATANVVLDGSNGATPTTVSLGGSDVDVIANFENFAVGAGNDTVWATHGRNIVWGGAGNDAIYAYDGEDTLYGGAGDDTLEGGYYGGSTLNGDVLYGGAGVDYLDYVGSTVSLTIDLAEGGAYDDTYYDIEAIRSGSGNDTLGGDAADNFLRGGAGDDVYMLRAEGGDDTIEEYDGSADAIRVLDISEIADIRKGPGTSWQSLIATLQDGTRLEALYQWGASNYRIELVQAGTIEEASATWHVASGYDGTTLAEVIVGDLYYYDHVDWNYGQGGDDLMFGGDLDDHLFGGTGNDRLAGGEHDDVLTGEDGDDLLVGGADNDTLYGGAGNDTASYVYVTANLAIDLADTSYVTIAAGLDVDRLFGMENATGGSGDDTLIGTSSANVLSGGRGDDTLRGGGGEDTFYGGYGEDTLSWSDDTAGYEFWLRGDAATTAYGDSGYVPAETADGGHFGTVGDRHYWGIEGFQGGAGDDVFRMGQAANVVEGGAGQDTVDYDGLSTGSLVSGAGVTLALGGGMGRGGWASGDRVSGVEVLIGSALDDAFAGEDDAVTIGTLGTGSDLAVHVYETRTGADGVDTYWRHEGGDETFFGGAGNDGLDGRLGDDTLYGGGESDSLFGGYGHDTAYGGDGNDTLAGGVGDDVMYGGAGHDVFRIGLYATGAPPCDDTIYGGSGNDTVAMADLAEIALIERGAGNDLIFRLADGGTVVAVGGAGSGDGRIAMLVDDASGREIELPTTWSDAGDTLDDALFGNTTASTLTGADGADLLFGGGGNDTLYGGRGDDTLVGGVGNDTYYGGDEDTVTIGATTTTPGGNDYVSFAGDDGVVLTGTVISDTVDSWSATISGQGGDVFAGIEGFIGSSADDTMTGRDDDFERWFDTLLGAYGDDTLSGRAGDDSLSGGEGEDLLYGGLGADTMSGGGGDDTFIADAGADVMFGGDGFDWVDYAGSATGVVARLNIGAGLDDDTVADTTHHSAGDSYAGIEGLRGGVETDRLYGDAAVNTLDGRAGDDLLDGGLGDDVLIGGEPTGTLTHGGRDTLIGGFGRDTLYGGDNDDLYEYALGDGDDTIFEDATLGGTSDVLSLDSMANVRRIRRGDDPTNTIANDDRALFVEYADGAVISILDEFVDGRDVVEAIRDRSTGRTYLVLGAGSGTDTIGDAEDEILVAGASGSSNTLYGGLGGDVLFGDAAADSLYGGAGDDTLFGGAANDRLDGGTGIDRVTYAAAGAGVVVDLSAGTASVNGTGEVDQLVSIEGVVATAYADTVYGGSNNDILSGGAGVDRLEGGGGDDTIEGGAANDTLYGGSGNDLLSYERSRIGVFVDLATSSVSGGHAAGDVVSGFEHVIGTREADTIYGGSAANSLFGGGGRDTIAGGNNSDTVGGGSGADTLYGGDDVGDILSYAGAVEGVTIDLSSSIATGGDAEGDVISGFEGVVGGGGDDTLSGTAYADLIGGGAGGNDTLQGGLGNDTYQFDRGGGHDTVRDEYGTTTTAAGTDRLAFGSGVAVADVFARIGAASGSDDLQLGLRETDSTLKPFDSLADRIDLVDWFDTARRVESFTFTDGTTLDLAGIGAHIGTDEADTVGWTLTAVDINVWAGDDTVTTGSADDIVEGGADGDTLDGGGGFDMLSYLRDTAGVAVTLGATASGGDAQGDVAVNFEGLIGGSAADTLAGDTFANVIEGAGGNDVLSGGGGVDTLSYGHAGAAVTAAVFGSGTGTVSTGGAGTDIVTGFLHLVGGGHGDSLSGSADVNTIWGGLGDDVLKGADGSTLYGDILYGGSGTDYVSFEDRSGGDTFSLGGTTLGGDTITSIEGVRGTTGGDTIFGTSGADGLDGWSGVDQLYGGIGADEYRWQRGNGNDTIWDNTAGGTDASVDTLRFMGVDTSGAAAAITLDDLSVSLSGADLDIVVGGTGGAHALVKNWTSTDRKVERIVTSDGVILDISGVSTFATGTSGADTMTGGGSVDWLAGGDAADTIAGLGGADIVQAGAGDDTVSGGAGADILAGGAGNDVYAFNLGDGQDTIVVSGGGNDTLRFGPDIAFDQLWLERSGDDLVISVIGTTDSVRQTGWGLASSPPRLHAIHAGGYGLDTTGMLALVAAMAELEPPAPGETTLPPGTRASLYGDDIGDWTGVAGDTMFGTSGADTITVGGGDDPVVDAIGGADVVTGDGRVNTLLGGGGDDTLDGAGGIDALFGGAGDDTLKGANAGDRLAGGAGRDVADYRSLSSAISLDLVTGAFSIGGSAADDQLFDIEGLIGGTGNDVLYGGVANDYFRGGAGADLFYGGAGGQDTLSYEGSSSGVYVTISGGGYLGYGGDAAGDAAFNVDAVVGSSHADTIYGTSSADTLVGGAGNDTLMAVGGDDAYSFDTGWGNDLVTGDTAGTDTLRFGAGIAAGDFQFAASGSDATLTGAPTTDVIRLAGWSTSGNRVETAAFVDGSTLSLAGMTAGATGTSSGESVVGGAGNDWVAGLSGDDSLYGGAADDILTGGAGADTLYGGAGNDQLAGGAGNDVYVFGRGGGSDRIEAVDVDTSGVVDVVDFGREIQADQLWLERSGDDLVISVLGTTDSVVVSGWFATPVAGMARKLDEIRALGFRLAAADADLLVAAMAGMEVTRADLARLSPAQRYQSRPGAGAQRRQRRLGGALDDPLLQRPRRLLLATTSAATFTGGSGVDVVSYESLDAAVAIDMDTTTATIAGAGGVTHVFSSIEGVVGGDHADTLRGDANENWLFGGYGNDTLQGRAGADHLFGGAGRDIASYAGSSSVTVYLSTGTNSGGEAAGDVLFDFEGVIGGGSADTFYGGATDDLFIGGAGIDSYYGGDGVDTVSYDGSSAVTIDSSGNGSGGDAASEYVDSSIEAVAGSENADVLHNASRISYLYGGAGNDTLTSSTTSTLDGGAGVDTMYGGGSADAFRLGHGDGVDTIHDTAGSDDRLMLKRGTELSDLRRATIGGDVWYGLRDPDDLEAAFADLPTRVRVAAGAIERIASSDGFSFAVGDLALAEGSLGADTMEGGDGNDWITTDDGDDYATGDGDNDVVVGGAGRDQLYGGAGDDVLDGGAGNDTLDGGAGNDVYRWAGGGGTDSVVDGGGNDTLWLGDGLDETNLWFQVVGHDLRIHQMGVEGTSLTIRGWYDSADNRLETIRTADRKVSLSDLEALRQAMATFAPESDANAQIPAFMPDQLRTPLAAAWTST